jgi:hypothetical protein
MNVLKDIGKILAKALENEPGLAAICLLVLLGAAVIIVLRAEKKVPWLFGLIFFAILMAGGISCLEIMKQNGQWRTVTKVQPSPTVNSGTIAQRLTDKQKKDIRLTLQKATEDVSGFLKINPDLLRANLFAPDEHGNMHIIQELAYNMHRTDEMTLNIPVGYGSTGRCFQSGQPNIAVFRGGWREAALAEEELKKLDPDLQWVISVPVKGTNDDVRPIWVMNIDCLKQQRDETELQGALGHLYAWSYTISIIISQIDQHILRQPLDQSVTISQTTPLQVHSLITNIRSNDIAYPSEHFIESTAQFESVSPLNSFTKAEFNKQVQEHFVSYKSPQ